MEAHKHLCALLSGLFVAIAAALSVMPAAADTPVVPGVSITQIRSAWADVQSGLRANDLKKVNAAILEVENLRRLAGYTALNQYSLTLVREGEARAAAGDAEGAAFFARSALRLSPSSPEILFASLPLVSRLGVASSTGQFFEAIGNLHRSPVLLLSIVGSSIQPFLLAVTGALYLVFVLFIIFWIPDVLRGMTGYFPAYMRGVATPIVTFACLAIPLFFSPLFCLVAWGLVLHVSDSRRRWPCLATGVLFAAWGVLVPLREQMKAGLASPGVRTVLDLASGTLGGIDGFELEKHVRSRPGNGAAWFVYGQVLRKAGRYNEALQALDRADMLLPGSPSVKIELATVYALLGEPSRAKELLASAESVGGDSPALFFNRSKLEISELDTSAARTSLAKAERADPAFTKELRVREEAVGPESPVSYADAQLPLLSLARSLWDNEGAQSGNAIGSVFPGFNPRTITILGTVLCLIGAWPHRGKRQRRIAPYYSEYLPSLVTMSFLRIVPGGIWILCERPLRAVVTLTIVLLAIMPIVEWPGDARLLLEFFPNAFQFYAVCAAFVVLVLMGWSAIAGERA